MREVFFYFFAALAVLSGLLVITRRNPLTAALYLVLAFFALAGVYVLMDAFFLAAVQVAVYAGAIMVLFLFVIMLLNLGPDDLPPIMTRRVRWLYAAASAALVLLFLGLDLGRRLPAPTPGAAGEVGAIAARLFGDYLLPFEITAVLLLVAIVGSVALAHRE
ncbi:NADH-quinone oxidoreductase subunit J [bacterium]|nr:NADH-quinone oxidoreductase subunit J [bacterium]